MRKEVRGFTLMELMAVVAIAGVLAAIAFPAMTAQVHQQKALEETVQLVQALKNARNLARSNRKCVKVVFTAGSGSFTLEQLDADADDGDNDVCDLPVVAPVTIPPVATPNEHITVDTSLTLYFYQNGSVGPLVDGVELNPPRSFNISQPNGSKQTVSIYGAIGRVTLNNPRLQ